MTVKTAGGSGRLNAFQKMMCYWSELHPYNASHTYRLAGPLRLEDLRDAIRETFELNGLGVVHLDLQRGTFKYEPDSEVEVRVLAGETPLEQQLGEHLSEELNSPFERPTCHPFRFSVFGDSPNTHCLSVVYDHWLADSMAARLVLRHVLGRYCGFECPANRQPLALYPGTFREVFGDRLGRLHSAAVMLRSFWQATRSGNTVKVAYACAREMTARYAWHRTAPGTVPQLADFARSQNATVHDVILAALGRALAECLPRRAVRGNRDVALGTIVDARPDARVDLGNTLGAFLGYYVARCRPEHADSLADTTRRIAAQTGVIKATRSYLDSLINWKLIGLIWPWLRAGTRPYFTQGALNLTGGVSNIRICDSWIDRQGAGQILDVIRASPTGPMLPLVLTPTTLHDQMNVGVNYRAIGFSRDKIGEIMACFLDQIQNPFAAAARRNSGARWASQAAACDRPSPSITASSVKA